MFQTEQTLYGTHTDTLYDTDTVWYKQTPIIFQELSLNPFQYDAVQKHLSAVLPMGDGDTMAFHLAHGMH